MSKSKIIIIHTGGTIASKVDYKTGAVVAKFEPEELYALYPELKEVSDFDIIKVANIMSEDVDFNFVNELALAIKKGIKKETKGIIITHGTDTIHYTSAALHFMLKNLPIPVILVGAQRSSDRPSSDAGMNLICAARFIIKTNWGGVGVCMHENQSDESCVVLPGEKARKMHSSRRDAFMSFDDGLVARVSYLSGEVEMLHKVIINKEKFELTLIDKNIWVGLIKVHPGFDPKILRNYINYSGLVIEGTGLGHVHENCLPEIENLIKKGVKVIMATQTIFGVVNMNVYSRGRKLLEVGVKGNYENLPPESVFMKLLIELSKGS